MTPHVNTFFSMEAMTGLQWLRVFVCMVIVYTAVEVEKALVDPLLMPMIKPVLRWFESLTPQFLSVDKPLSARLARICGRKNLERMDSQYKFQKRGKFKRGGDKRKKADGKAEVKSEGMEGVVSAAGVGVQMQDGVGSGRGRELALKQLSLVVERTHDGAH
jgi:hypothetical protein